MTPEQSPCGQRIAIIGTTGSGKTTLAAQIAARLALPHIEMDALYWNPNWTAPDIAVFRERVSSALAGARWVADGNYSKVRDIVWGRAETLVWLDYSGWVIFKRLFVRTMRRAYTQEELWNGNRESFRGALLSRDSLFLWALKTHGRHRRQYPALLAQPEYAHLRVIRLTSPHQTERWLAQLNSTGQPGIKRG